MKYSQEMILQSPSGYCMPFEEHDKEVEMTLGYGKQLHPKTGVEFFHHGVDFSAPHYLLSAVASGIVSGGELRPSLQYPRGIRGRRRRRTDRRGQ